MTNSSLPKLAAPALAAILMLSACGQADTPPPPADTTGNAMTDGDEISTAPVTQPEGAVDPDGAGSDEAYGQRGDQNAPDTNIDQTGEAVNISGDGKSTESPGN